MDRSTRNRHLARPLIFVDETTLRTLEQALTDVWQVLKAHDPFRDWDKDDELKRGLAEKLMALADGGVRDLQELRNRTLEIFDLGARIRTIGYPESKVASPPQDDIIAVVGWLSVLRDRFPATPL